MPDIIERELEGLEGRWELKPGKKHAKLFVDGRLAGILPRTYVEKHGLQQAALNTRAQIRRIVRQA